VPQNLDELYAEVGASGARPGQSPRSPSWLDEVPGAPSPRIRGQLELPTNPDPLPLLGKAATGLGLLGLLYGMDHWARPVLKAGHAKQPGDLFSLISSVWATLTRWVNPRMRYVTHAVSKGAAHNAASPAWMFGVLGLRWTQAVGQIMYLARDAADAFERLTHTVIPREINRKVNPVRTEVRQTKTTVRKHGAQITTIRRYITRVIERTLRPEIRRIHTTVTRTLPQRIHKTEVRQTRTETRVKTQGRQITRLMTLLTITGAVSLVLRAFSRMGLNFLRCQNFKDVGRDICASPPGSGKRLGKWLRRLLSMGSGILFLSQFCRIFELMAAEGAPIASKLVETIGVAGAALCNGKYDAAPPLPLHLTANPPVRGGLPI
jgi:hypothetical protein